MKKYFYTERLQAFETELFYYTFITRLLRLETETLLPPNRVQQSLL